MEDATTILPCPGFVLMEPVEKENRTAGGLELPDSSQEEHLLGKVLAIGAATTVDGAFMDSPVKEGDIVAYRKYKEQGIKVHGVEYKTAHFIDLIAVIKNYV